ncbi:hypothetical protein RFI_07249 [Reticulomyxa filosa]|uniref:Fe2OG dioxygenase domain-containing protein n=1 Tax=Reticulomyxa filosa TaxID=46433 RepID=X6NV63_RETFI|nr:hypothetical protein RFI_07249 [Reticulomyxa filosa]|eukprot:ETO29871.1 hypothetical protein RFI_07249 [Reticulomyxa filosa]
MDKVLSSSQARIEHDKIKRSCIWSVSNIWSEEECKHYIEATETMGYESIDWEYAPEYRNCQRVLTLSETVSKDLWLRLRKHLTKEAVDFVRPFGFGNEGVWIPLGINAALRFTKYGKGHYFKPHRDGSFVHDANLRSVYTVMIYLNEDFEGGETRFFHTHKNERYLTSNDFDAFHVRPATGTCLIFNHDVSGTKYISHITNKSHMLCITILFLFFILYYVSALS